MIAKKPACRVEILLIRKKMLMFDFGDFGIVIRRIKSARGDHCIPYYQDGDYVKKFMASWYRHVDHQMDPESKEVSVQVLDEIKAILEHMPWDEYACNILCGLLWKFFEKELRLYRGI